MVIYLFYREVKAVFGIMLEHLHVLYKDGLYHAHDIRAMESSYHLRTHLMQSRAQL